MTLPNLINDPDTVDMGTTKRRQVLSNARDRLLANNQDTSINVDCTAGGTIVLTVAQREPVQLIRLTGSPGGAFTVEFADGNKQAVIENASGQTATIETATGAASPPTILDGVAAIIQVRGTDISVNAVVSLEVGALLHSGQVNPTGTQDWADHELKGAKFVDLAYVVTSPSSAAKVLTLDCENGNWFDVTLTEDIDDLIITNPAIHFSGIRLEDGLGELILEDGSGKLLQEENDAVANVFLITRQDGGGGHVVTFPSIFKWERGTGESPTPSVGPNDVDIYWFSQVKPNAVWFSHQLGKNMG